MKHYPILINDYLNKINGKSTLSQIFNSTPPAMKTWTDPNEIFEILDIIAGSDPSHCALLPGGGHFDLKDVGMPLNGHIDLNDCISHRFPIISLSFVNFFGDNYYFLLESNASTPSGLTNLSKEAIAETVAESEPGEYIARKFHDNYDSYEHNFGSYQKQYPVRPHLVRRYLKESSVLIVKNDNPYRFTRISSDGYHNQLAPGDFKVFMQNLFIQDEMTNP
jgi:hypothetical protein